MWSVTSKKLLKTFTGHASEVYSLTLVPSRAAETPVSGHYVVSAAVDDRHINLWKITDNVKNSIATFLLPESSTQIFISKMDSENNIIVLAITKTGYLIVYRSCIDGVQKKPLLHKYFVQVATSHTDRPVPILFASISSNQNEFTICYGELMNVTFETLKLADLKEKTTLIREDVFKRPVVVEGNITNTVVPKMSNNISVVEANVNAKTSKSRKRSESSEPSMGDCLIAMSDAKTDVKTDSKSHAEVPQANTMSTLLTQGLASSDRKILNSVLQRSDSTLIANTLKGLPTTAVVPLIKELEKRTRGHSQAGMIALKWLRETLVSHTAFLMSYPHLRGLLGNMHNMMENRVSVYSRLSKVQGKLDIMLSQISLQASHGEVETNVQHPIMIYQDESEDELFNQESSDEDEWGHNMDSNSDDNIEDNEPELMEMSE